MSDSPKPNMPARIPIGSFDNERLVNGVPMLPIRDVDLPPNAQVYDDVRVHDGQIQCDAKLAHVAQNEWFALADHATQRPMG